MKLLAAPIAVLVAGCSFLVPPRTPTATPSPFTAKAAQAIERGVCLDPSLSAETLAADVREDLVRQIRHRVPDRIPPTGGVGPADRLTLTVRLVTTDSYASNQFNLVVTVPGIDELPERPDLGAPGVTIPGGAYQQWTARKSTVQAQLLEAREAARRAARQVTSMSLPRDGNSGVTACLAALAEVSKGDLMLASDLEENVQAVDLPDLDGRRVFLVWSCPDGDAQACRHRRVAFREMLKAKGATVTAVRPENAADAIRGLLGGA